MSSKRMSPDSPELEGFFPLKRADSSKQAGKAQGKTMATALPSIYLE